VNADGHIGISVEPLSRKKGPNRLYYFKKQHEPQPGPPGMYWRRRVWEMGLDKPAESSGGGTPQNSRCARSAVATRTWRPDRIAHSHSKSLAGSSAEGPGGTPSRQLLAKDLGAELAPYLEAPTIRQPRNERFAATIWRGFLADAFLLSRDRYLAAIRRESQEPGVKANLASMERNKV
jgi:hypothetical protein